MRHMWSCLPYAGVLFSLMNDNYTQAATTAGVYARLGGPVTVTWAMSPIKEFIVKKDYRVMFHITGNNEVTFADKELRTRVSTVSYTRGTFSFHLYNVTSSDAGQYSCYVDSPFPPYRRVRKSNCGQTLYVVDFQDHSILFQREQNGTVTLACNYRIRIHPDSSPTVFVGWRENDVRLYIGERIHMRSSKTWNRVDDGRQINHTSMLIIRNGWQENYRYMCRMAVQKIYSEWSEEISPIRWSDENTNCTVVPEEDDAMMTWKMPSLDSGSYITSPSGPHLMWKLADRWNVGHTYMSRLEIRGTRPTSESVIVRLLLHNVTGRDAGKYLCVSGHHQVPQCGHTLIVSRSPEQPNTTTNKLNLNQEVTLTCSSTSRSLPKDHNLTMSYSWKRNNIRLTGGRKYQMSGPNLTITDVREDTKYSCQSTEAGGQVSRWSSEFVLTAKLNIPFPTISATSFIIGCAIEVLALLAVAAIVLRSRKANRDYWNQRFRDCYITYTISPSDRSRP